MSDPVARSNDVAEGAHESAARAFVHGVERRDIPGVEELRLFGSTVRGEASGIASDVDFLAVVADDVDRAAIEDQLRDLAYDVMLEYGPVVEVHVFSRAEFERRRRQNHPFIRRILREGEAYV